MIIRVYGNLRSYRSGSTVLAAAEIIAPEDGEMQMLFHTLRIASEWLYLTGKEIDVKRTKEMDHAQDAIELARRGRVEPSSSQRQNPYSMAQEILEEQFEKEERESLSKQEIISIIASKLGQTKAVQLFSQFIEDGIIMETEEDYYKLN